MLITVAPPADLQSAPAYASKVAWSVVNAARRNAFSAPMVELRADAEPVAPSDSPDEADADPSARRRGLRLRARTLPAAQRALIQAATSGVRDTRELAAALGGDESNARRALRRVVVRLSRQRTAHDGHGDRAPERCR